MMSNKEVILEAVNSMPMEREFTRNDLFLMVCELVKTSTFSFFFNKVLVKDRIKVTGKVPNSNVLLYRRKF
ncbi:hypothetical protein [uncultured Parabacteroides sp.]|uniref:hypothetical protein n=1 Tax=uncultured Parabacteroides sp. TaxID=512312 RepID=UPI0025CD2F7F|nr:hypothetical protein [uncultured Parabacteroides sp.]